MLNKIFNQKQLLDEACNRLDNCDELLLLRAFKKMSNTEISSLISALPVHHANQILIILPSDITRRISSVGFNSGKLNNDTLRKLIGAIDREIELFQLKTLPHENNTNRYIGPKSGSLNKATSEATDAEPAPEVDTAAPASVRLLDTFGRFIGNSFKKQ